MLLEKPTSPFSYLRLKILPSILILLESNSSESSLPTSPPNDLDVVVSHTADRLNSKPSPDWLVLILIGTRFRVTCLLRSISLTRRLVRRFDWSSLASVPWMHWPWWFLEAVSDHLSHMILWEVGHFCDNYSLQFVSFVCNSVAKSTGCWFHNIIKFN